MERREPLTNESISKKFSNQFDMVKYAIALASQLIKSGRAPRVHADSDNPAVIVIEEIQEGKDQLEDLPSASSAVLAVKESLIEESNKTPVVKQTERKKARRLMA